ncbi:MAG: tRNA (adenosine(37)-N6)-threonylcarbamoyltransferase complex transferase subunit TsaD, partial [Pseudomonadota bacterium]
MTAAVTVLGIESSCDDTAAAVLSVSPRETEILSSIVIGQTDLHADFGGVVPEIAARAHAEKLDSVTAEALSVAGVELRQVDIVAVTAGPG